MVLKTLKILASGACICHEEKLGKALAFVTMCARPPLAVGRL
jgi:hypothetical protein